MVRTSTLLLHAVLYGCYLAGGPPQDRYQYTNQLLALDACLPHLLTDLPAHLSDVITPLMAKVWAERLKGHPDRAFSEYIVAGLAEGFRIGFDYSQARLAPSRGNMRGKTFGGRRC